MASETLGNGMWCWISQSSNDPRMMWCYLQKVLRKEENNITEIIRLFLYLNVAVMVPLVQSVHLGRLIDFKFDALTAKSSSPAGTEIK